MLQVIILLKRKKKKKRKLSSQIRCKIFEYICLTIHSLEYVTHVINMLYQFWKEMLKTILLTIKNCFTCSTGDMIDIVAYHSEYVQFNAVPRQCFKMMRNLIQRMDGLLQFIFQTFWWQEDVWTFYDQK